MLITLPYILSCILMSTASSVYILFLTNIVIGITVGFTEAPINNYFGEICQPELRSILAGSACKSVLSSTMSQVPKLSPWPNTFLEQLVVRNPSFY
jgi:hypothetical protein